MRVLSIVLVVALLHSAVGQWKGWGGQQQQGWGGQQQQGWGGQQQQGQQQQGWGGPPPPPPPPPEPPVPAQIHTMRGCADKGSHFMCSNVYIYGQNLLGQLPYCQPATPDLRARCQDTWDTSPQECCWCDQGSCLLRARRAERYFVPKNLAVVAEPHFRDWRGQSWDYQGQDDHIMAEVTGYRVDIKLSSCSDRSRVTCITEVALVDTTNKRTAQFKVNDPFPSSCGENKLVGEGDKFTIAGITLEKLNKGGSLAKWTAKLGGKLVVEVVIEKELIDLLIKVGPEFKDGDILGGLLTGTAKSQVAKYWAKGVVRKIPANVLRIGVNSAWDFASSWRLNAADSYICSTRVKPYGKDAPRLAPLARVKDVVNNENRMKYYECCMMLQCSPEAYDECVFDHVELNRKGAPAKCINGYHTYAEEACQRTRAGGDCKGGWSAWGVCENGKQSRRFVIERVPLPGFGQCPYNHDEVEVKGCQPNLIVRPAPVKGADGVKDAVKGGDAVKAIAGDAVKGGAKDAFDWGFKNNVAPVKGADGVKGANAVKGGAKDAFDWGV